MTISELCWEVRRKLFPRGYPRAMGAWPLRVDPAAPPERVAELKARAADLAARSQYGWGQTVDFGPFAQEGFLGRGYLEIVGLLDQWGWWPESLAGKEVADVGCFTGGHTALLAHRGARRVWAVDELPEHLEQARLLTDAFGLEGVEFLHSSVYKLYEAIQPGSLDMVVLSGVLYHLSDMLVGLLMMRRLLKPGGLLLIESNGADDSRRSFANFGRYWGGMWWQPSGLCIRDMCAFMGFADAEVRFYKPDRFLARAVNDGEAEIPFKRGMNWDFPELADAERRTMDRRVMAGVRPRLW